MPRTSVSPADAGDPGRALRELAALVADALWRLTGGSTPATAGGLCYRSAGGAPGGPPLSPALREATTPRTVHRASPGAATRSQPSVAGGADAAGARTTEPTGEHAEVWQLVRRAQQGDGDAFGLLYDRYVDTVYRFVYFRVNDRALAEDFTSETFLRALRRIRSLRYQGRDVGAWFITIARNIVFDHTKSARRRLEVATADLVDSGDTEPGPEEAAIAGLVAQRLLRAVGELGAEQRECVQLRFIQGLSVSETAAALGKNEGAVKALQHRAVRKLAELVGEDLR